MGWVAAWSWCGLLWWLVVIALVTLVPLYGIDLAVPAETRSETCSLDYGGPAPEGFWVFSGVSGCSTPRCSSPRVRCSSWP